MNFTEFDNAWLGLGDINSLSVPHNPMIHRTKEDIENPDLHLIRLLRDPLYLGSTCKLLFNIELHPMQTMVLQEIWNRPFPMLIGSRGFSKLLRSDELIRVKDGWKKMEDIQIGDKVYGSDGKLANVISKTDKQSNVNMYRITLRDGRSIECCEDHMWKVWDKNNNRKKNTEIWSELTTKEMVANYYWDRIGDKSNGKESRYALPINKPLLEEQEQKLIIHPYVLGVLLGDGGITTSGIIITSEDQEIIDKVQSLLPDGYYLKSYGNLRYRINKKNKKLPSFYKLLEQIGLFPSNSHTKFIPQIYQYSSYEQKLELIRGLMDTDGTAKRSNIVYSTVSTQLCKDFLNVARSIGLHCKHAVRESWFNGKRCADCNTVTIYTKTPIFSLSRKLDNYLQHSISKQGFSKYNKVFITNIEYIGKGEGYCISVDNADKTYITKDYIVTHNSFLLALYAVLKCTFYPGTKVVIVGAAFRQSKIIFEYMENIWKNSPILRSIFNGNEDGPRRDVDRCTLRLGDSWAIAIPLGNGDKIRGLRAHIILADEFSSISPDIYETVVSGFAAVSASPIQNVKEEAKKSAMKLAGIWNDQLDTINYKINNQAVISGTADYGFKHFAQYWKRYKAIIESKGDQRKLQDIFNGEVPNNFNWKDYSIIRIPYELIPKGFMDDKQVSRAKATIHVGIYNMEYAACFVNDSQGFFRRSLIESCVTKDNPPIYINNKPVIFDAITQGNPNSHYVYGIDPASEQDNFSIIILEVHPTHSRIVYCWATNRNNFKERQKIGLVKEYDFYGFCARKIRDLMKTFPPIRIGMDAQGGGVAIEEALHDPGKLQEGEQLIWPIIDYEKSKDTDNQQGLHILELVQFAKADWTSQANHGLRKDLEDKTLLFPRFDNLTLGLAMEKEGKNIIESDLTPLYDSVSECILEIEELKNELTTIVMTQTSTGPNARDRWDTPEVKLPNGKKGRLRKDRYSSLLIANMIARQSNRTLQPISYDIVGGDTREISGSNNNQMYKGPEWFTNNVNDNDIYQGIYR